MKKALSLALLVLGISGCGDDPFNRCLMSQEISRQLDLVEGAAKSARDGKSESLAAALESARIEGLRISTEAPYGWSLGAQVKWYYCDHDEPCVDSAAPEFDSNFQYWVSRFAEEEAFKLIRYELTAIVDPTICNDRMSLSQEVVLNDKDCKKELQAAVDAVPPGLEDADEYYADLMRLSALLNRENRTSYAALNAEKALELVERIRLNGHATYLAVGCVASEALQSY